MRLHLSKQLVLGKEQRWSRASPGPSLKMSGRVKPPRKATTPLQAPAPARSDLLESLFKAQWSLSTAGQKK